MTMERGINGSWDNNATARQRRYSKKKRNKLTFQYTRIFSACCCTVEIGG